MLNLSQRNRKSTPSNVNWKNKENQVDWMKGQKDICKILSHLNSMIHQNKHAIFQMRKEFAQKINLNQTVIMKDSSKGIFNYESQFQKRARCIEQFSQDPMSQFMNQTSLTVSKIPEISNRSFNPQSGFNLLNQKLDSLNRQFKRKQTQDMYNLEKRLSQKGDKTQIEKALNLSKLLVVEIHQIQERFKENEKITKSHEQTILKLCKNFQVIDRKVSIQTKSLNQRIREVNFVQNQTLSRNLSQLQKLKSCFEAKVDEIVRENDSKIQIINRVIEKNSMNEFQKEIDQIYTRLVNLQSGLQSNLSQQQFLSKDTKVQLLNKIAQQNKNLTQKIKKSTQNQIIKKLDSLDKLYAKKAQILKGKNQTDLEIKTINESVNKLSSTCSHRFQRLQKSINSLQLVLQSHNTCLMTQIAEVTSENEIKLTSAIQDMKKTLSTKYVKSQAMKNYFQEQNQKVSQIIDTNFQEQKQVNEILCSENILGRWLWQSQELKGGNLISWDKEIINTLPENFKFFFDKSTSIEIANGGIYKFELGFYSKKKPTIQILINGKVIMSAVNSSSYVMHHSSGKLKDIEPTQMSGLTLVDFFLIPENSRIAVAYSGDTKGEGFLNIHRM